MSEVLQFAYQGSLSDGSLDAFLQLRDDFKIPVFQFFYRLLSSSEVAERSTEQVFLRAFRLRRLVRTGTDLRGWIFRVACDQTHDPELKKLLQAPTSQATAIEQAVRRLPLPERMALLLHHFARLTNAQIAIALRLTEVAVRQLLQETYTALQQQVMTPNQR